MAKSKSFFGLRTGSTKSLTFSVYRGTQITKDRVTRVANPRTIAQMQQRAKVPLVAAARVALAGLVDHSFEGVPYGQASLQMFSSLNLANGVLNVVSYPPNGVSNMGCADFIVSKGSLLNPFKIVDPENYCSGEIALPSLNNANVFPKMVAGTKGSTVAYFANKAFALNPAWRENSQLTSLCIANVFNYVIQNYGGNSMTRTVPLFKPFIERFVFPDSYPAGEQTVASLDHYHDDNDYWKLLKDVPEAGAATVSLSGPNGEVLEITFKAHESATINMHCGSAGKTIVAGCLIFSQLDGTTWKRSHERLMLAKDEVLQTVKPFTFTDWMQAYTGTVVSTKYLNTGNAATGITGQRPPRRNLPRVGGNAARDISGQNDLNTGNASTGISGQNG